MMAEIINDEKLPWPGQLVDLSYKCLKWGFIFFVVGVPFGIAGMTLEIQVLEVIGGLGLFIFASSFAMSFTLSLIALLGMPFNNFRLCGLGRALKMLIFTYIVFSLGFAITGPALMKAKSEAHKINCLSNLKMLNLACQIYRANNGERWPLNNWADQLNPYYEDKKILQCPTDKTGPCSYAMNENIPPDAKDLPGDLVLLFESAPGWSQTGGPDDVITDRHKNPGANIAFADGHIEFVKPEDIPTLRWRLEAQKGGAATTR